MDVFRHASDFNRDIIGIPCPEVPTRLTDERKQFGADHMQEELDEFRDAETIDDEVDALQDIIYVAAGRLYEMGCDGSAHFMAVHGPNMRKKRGTKASRPGSRGFDAVKPDGWVGPDHASILARTRNGVAHPAQTLADLQARQIEEGMTDAGKAGHNSAKPRVLLIGHGRHGKDTVAEVMRDQYGYQFTSSSLFCAAQVMMPAFSGAGKQYETVEHCFGDRHGESEVGDHRTFWFETIKAFCTPDKARLARAIFDAGNDLYVGIRDREELAAAQCLGNVVTVWVDASDRLPPEQGSSMNLSKEMADYVLDNNGSVDDLPARVAVLMRSILA